MDLFLKIWQEKWGGCEAGVDRVWDGVKNVPGVRRVWQVRGGCEAGLYRVCTGFVPGAYRVWGGCEAGEKYVSGIKSKFQKSKNQFETAFPILKWRE